MITLRRLVFRSAGVAALTLAIAALPWGTARAQSADSSSAAMPANPAGAKAAAPPMADTGSTSDATQPAAAATTHEGAPSAPAASAAAAPKSTAPAKTASSGMYDLHQALKGFSGQNKRPGDDVFERASSLFPAFCKDWGRKLHDRELNNRENMTWKDKDGYKTGTYLGYSAIKTCLTKRSTGGVPIGELTYMETEYFLEGKTVADARNAQPKTVGLTHTTEIFRWDHNQWVY